MQKLVKVFEGGFRGDNSKHGTCYRAHPKLTMQPSMLDAGHSSIVWQLQAMQKHVTVLQVLADPDWHS